MPQAVQQAQSKAKTMDEAMQETIAAHEDGQQEAPEEASVEAAPDQAEAQAEVSEGEEGQPEDKAEEPKVEAQKQSQPAKPQLKDGKDGKQPASKPIPALSSWPPHLRDQFHTLPRPIKDQIIKSQGDFARGLAERDRQISAAKQQAEAAKPITEALAPFMGHLQAVGVAPGAAVRNLFQTEYVLRTGADGQKAQVVANLMGAYGISPATLLKSLPRETLEALPAVLLAVLEGKPAPEAQGTSAERPQQRRQPEQEPRDPRLDILLDNLKKQAQTQKASQEQQDEVALNEFLNSGEAEFFDDVAADMADLAKLPKNKGLSFKQLYEKACLLNDDVRSVLEKRKAEEAAALRSQKAQQARRAASSVKTEPGAPQGARKLSLEDALKANIEAYYGPQAT